MITIRIDFSGFEEATAHLRMLPSAIHAAILRATERATDETKALIDLFTPVRTGMLVGSIGTEVTETPSGARGVISTQIRYARFVEFGTKEHGEAQRMFQRGAMTARQTDIERFYREELDPVIAAL